MVPPVKKYFDIQSSSDSASKWYGVSLWTKMWMNIIPPDLSHRAHRSNSLS